MFECQNTTKDKTIKFYIYTNDDDEQNKIE